MSFGNDSGGAEQEDDDGFLYYLPNTKDLGGSLVAVSVFAVLFGYGVVLPFLVILKRRRDEKRKTCLEQTFELRDDDDDSEVAPQQQQRWHPSDDNMSSSCGSSEGGGLRNSTNRSASSSHRQQRQPRQQPHVFEYATSQIEVRRLGRGQSSGDGGRSVTLSINGGSVASSRSSISSAVAAILDVPHIPKTRAGRRRRRRRERQLQNEGGRSNSNSNNNNHNGMDPATYDMLQAIHPGGTSHTVNNRQAEAEPFVGSCSPAAQLAAAAAPISPPRRRPKYAEEFNTLESLDKVAFIASYDIEMRRIIKLSTPYCIQALITGFTDTMNVAVIGTLIGTKEVSAYVIVNLMVELSSEFVGGLHEALASLCSQAIGCNNRRLVGEYCQIVVVLYTLFFIPFMILWATYMASVLRWLGFDEETVHYGNQYTKILIVDLLIDGLGEAIHGLLDVGGHEKFSTLIGGVEEILASVTLLLVALFGSPGPGLVVVGLIQFSFGILFLVMNILIIYWKGWFRPYREGMIGTFALSNGKSVWLVARTALALSFGMLLTDGEWEILTIFASFLGPAEVAAWGILDTILQGTHELIDGLADAGEVRCAFLLGTGDPIRAKVSAYKSSLIGAFAALFLTSLIYMAGDDLPTWLTSDPALQQMLSVMLPLFGLVLLVMAIDTMSWTLVGSQGRYRLATIVVCLCSWFVSIPLAALFSVHLRVNLQGQLTAFMIGYLVMGIIHTYLLLSSDWEKLSEQVMEDNEATRLLIEDEAPVILDNPDTSSTSSPGTKKSLSPPSIISSTSTGSPTMRLPMEVSSFDRPEVL